MTSSTPPSQPLVSLPVDVQDGRQSQPQPQRHGPPSLSEVPSASITARPADPRDTSFPYSFIRPFQPNPASSTSLVPSTAEGKPIPVDDSTAENRTSALRELNHNYPSRHRYAKSTGAQSSTYSEPVIVRSYYTPLSQSRPASSTRGGVVIHGGPGIASGTSSISGRRNLPYAATVTSARSGVISRMIQARETHRLGANGADDAKLPPIEAFTFKSFLANMEAQEGSNDINADLDRIAEICARSKYSLSNQYEVHYAPHGSGAAFLESAEAQEAQGPTLQVVSPEEEQNMRRQRRRRTGPRKSSRAMGTLETIMSSSRSSDEDRSKKKSAAELAEEIRGRAARRSSGNSSPTLSSPSTSDDQGSLEEPAVTKTPPARRSASLALIDSSRQGAKTSDPTSPRTSTTLVGEPALPKASTSQLELRTAPEEPNKEQISYKPKREVATQPETRRRSTVVRASSSNASHLAVGGSILSVIGNWAPWKALDFGNRSPGRAEGSLRELLRTTDAKGKSVERMI